MRFAGLLLVIMGALVMVLAGFALGVREKPTLSTLAKANAGCNRVYSRRRVWVPAGSGCGPSLDEIRHIDLRDGRSCDYVYLDDKPLQLAGLWCDVDGR